MNCNAYDQQFIKNKFLYSFVRASTTIKSRQLEKHVLNENMDELNRYKQYLDLHLTKSVKPTDDSDTSSVVDDIPTANKKDDDDNKPNKFNEETEDDDSEANDDNFFDSSNKEDSEATQEDGATVIDAVLVDTSMTITNDARISQNGITSPNNNNVVSTNHPTSFISDIEFASTKTNRRRYVFINNQINKCKFYCYIFVMLSY